MKTVLGYTDEVTQCDCCGKSGLKGTFAVDVNGSGLFHYGSVCAFKKHGANEAEGKAALSQYKKEQSMLKITGFKTWAEWTAAQA